jgi:hypothetical protein
LLCNLISRNDTGMNLPTLLYHYYEASQGPFKNLSDLPLAEAEQIMNQLRQAGTTFASKRTIEYLRVRRELEDRVRAAFISKGGKPDRPRPHYMTLGRCPWLLSWYEQGKELSIPMDTFRPETLSFTYGDIFPAMRFKDGRPYRQQVYTLPEIPELVARFGLPQDWNADGHLGPERYIEAQVWSHIDCFSAR